MFTYTPPPPKLPDVVVNNQSDVESVSGVYKSSDNPTQNDSSENNFSEFLSKISTKKIAPAIFTSRLTDKKFESSNIPLTLSIISRDLISKSIMN